MLEHTEQLHQKVQGVESKLAQLEEQERILARQQETGERLAQELSRQVKLTEQGVTLMAEILEREQASVQLTSQVTAKVTSLTQDVGRNAELLDRLADPLTRAGQESTGLSGQLDLLLAELNRSRETFKYFGKLKDLLEDPLHPLPLPPLPNPLPDSPLPNPLPTPLPPLPNPFPDDPLPNPLPNPLPPLPSPLPLPRPLPQLPDLFP